MARFSANRPDALAANELLSQVVSLGGNQLHAYLLCGISNGAHGPRIYCVHFPTSFISSLEGQSSLWDHINFAFLGDVMSGQVTTVVFPNSAFDVFTARVRTPDYMSQHLDELTAESPLFPAEPPGAANTEEITVRQAIYLPAVYVPLLLSASGYTAKQVWERLYPAVLQRQDLEDCEPLIQWLQVASTGTMLAHQRMGDSLLATPLCSPPADELLLEQRLQLLHQILPDLLAPPTTLENALTQMASAIIHQTNDSRHARELKAARDLDPKLPSEKFAVTLPVLLEYLQTADERDLPELWHKWANGKKREEFQILRDTLEAFSRSPLALSTAIPVVSAKLVQDLLHFNFVGDSSDDIKTGFHPFIINDGNAEQRLANLEVARLYGYLQAGELAVSLQDLEALQAKEIRSVPLTYWELEKTLGAFGNLMGVVLGLTHPLMVAYTHMWKILNSGMRDELHAAIDHRGYVKPTHVLRSIQLGCYQWFSHKRARLTPPTPDFAIILNQILLQVYILPRLPATLYQLAYPRQQKPLHDALVPGLITPGSASGSSSDVSTITGLASATGGGSKGGSRSTLPPGSTTGRGAFVSNLAPLVSLTTLDRPNVKLRDLIANTAPPTMADGTDMCLSYHLRGGCWSNCKRATNHGRLLSATETQRLESYITQRLAALRPTTAQGADGSAASGIPP
jgi:hypothetical protein